MSKAFPLLAMLAASTVLIAPTAFADFIVESRSGGQNYGLYSEVGSWSNSSGKSTAPGVTPGIGSRYSSTLYSGRYANFAFKAGEPTGLYEVFVTWGANANRRAGIEHKVYHTGGTTSIYVDQSATANTWVSLGQFTLDTSSKVQIHTYTGVSGSGYADAVKFVYIPEPATLAVLGLGAIASLRRRRA